MDNPLISIIIPVYNTEKYLPACLDSILAQTYTNFEAILVDDGSKDGSGRICDEYAEKDSRFVVVHKDNEGVAKARITAFEHSKGELITFIDSDDYVSPLYLEKLAKPIIEKDADMVSCDYSYVNEKGQKTEFAAKLTGRYEGDNLTKFISRHYYYDKKIKGFGMTCFLCTKMVKRKYVLQGLQECLGLWFGEDQISMFSMLTRINNLILIPDRLYYYFMHDGQASSKYNLNLWNSIITMLERYDNLDYKGIAKNGLRKRTWIYIKTTIQNKMSKSSLNKREYCEHLKHMRNSIYMRKFFRPFIVDSSLKDNICYWILKVKLYSLLYKGFFFRA